MKNVFLFIALLVFQLGFSQANRNPRVYSVDYDELTTAQMMAISSPKEGQTIWNTEEKAKYCYDGSGWVKQGILEDDSVTPDKMADADFTAFTITDGVAVMNTSSVSSSHITDGSIQYTDLKNATDPDWSTATEGQFLRIGASFALELITNIPSDLISFDNSTANLPSSPSDVEAAINDIDARIDQNETDAADNGTGIATNLQTIDSIKTALATASKTAIDFNIITSSVYTLTAADAQDEKVVLSSTGNDTIKIPSGIFAEGESIRIESEQDGQVVIMPESGVDIPSWYGMQLDEIFDAVTVSRRDATTGPEIFIPTAGDKKPYFVPSPLASNPNPDLITATHALGWRGNEANAVPASGSGNNEYSSSTASVSVIQLTENDYGVLYALVCTATDNGVLDRIDFVITGLIDTELYEFAAWVFDDDANVGKQVSLQSGATFVNDGDATLYNSTAGWNLFEDEFAAVGTSETVRMFATASSGSVNDYTYWVVTVKQKDD